MRQVHRAVRRPARLKTRESESTVGSFSVRALAVNGKNDIDLAEEIMEVSRQSRCEISELNETRRDEQDWFTAAGFTENSSGGGVGGTEAKGQHRAGIALK